MQLLPAYSSLTHWWIRYPVYLAFLLVGVLFAYFFGAVSPLFSRATLGYFTTPIAVVSVLAIWALPKREVYGEKLCAGLALAYFAFFPNWPDYVSVLAPVTKAWLSPQKLILFSMIPVLLVIFSVSKETSKAVYRAYQDNKVLVTALLVLTATQIYTIPLYGKPVVTGTAAVKAILFQSSFFLIAIIGFRDFRVVKAFVYICALSCIFLGIVAIMEQAQQKPIWESVFPRSWIIYDEATSFILNSKVRVAAYRVTGPNNTPLEFAEFLALGSAMCLYLVVENKNLIGKALGVLGIGFGFYGILLSGSRLGIVAFLAVIATYTLLFSYRYYKNTKGSILGPAIMTMASLAAIVGVGLIFASNRVYGMIFGNNSWTANSSQARWEQWADGLPKFLMNPIGYGYGTSGEVLGFYSSGRLTIDTYWLSVLLESGLAGFLALLIMVIVACRNSIYVYVQDNKDNADFSAALTALFVAFFVSKLVLSQRYNHVIFFFSIGLACLYSPGILWASRKSKISDEDALESEEIYTERPTIK